ATFLDAYPIGEIFADSLGIIFPNGNLRSPDVTFVRNEKLKDLSFAGFPDFVPDLAVEVLSPNDRLSEVGQKIGEFLQCGVPVVWLVDPDHQTVTVYHS